MTEPEEIDDAEQIEDDDEAPPVRPPNEPFRWRVAKNIERRLDQYLVDRIGYLSRMDVQRLIKEGHVTVNGRPTKPSYHPRLGDEVVAVAPPPPISELVPEPIPLDIIYEDEHFLALNKQSNLIVHPARGQWTGTLVNGLVHYGKKWSSAGGSWRPGILHRLDRNTTGIMLVAKADEAHWRLARQFENRTIQKTYLAVIHGTLPLVGDVIDLPIGKDRYVREKQAVRKIMHGGKPAQTIYEVQETLEYRPAAASGQATHDQAQRGEHYSLVKLSPRTGRTHQLRVHMAAAGCPIVGDTMYGGRVFEAGDFRFERQALHAYEIRFVHPVTLEQMTLQAPLPGDIQRLLRILRGEQAPAQAADRRTIP